MKRVIGTAGHIDHGKTSLVRALTGIDCDRLPEEKRRGITIDLGFAHWSQDDLQIAFVDVPGHERFVKRMLAGVGGVDCALLVVAADESIKPQTREHLAICQLLRIPTGLVAITKSDLVDRDILELVRLEIEELVSGTFLEGKPIVAVSSATGDGIDALRGSIHEVVRAVRERDVSSAVFRLPIDRVFTMKGFGSVVTGTALGGSLTSDSEVEILPGGRKSRVRNIEVHGERRESAAAGERVSINLADIPTEDLERGQEIVEPGVLKESSILTVRLDLLPETETLEDGTKVRLHLHASEVPCRVRVIGAKEVSPGGRAWVQLRLDEPVLALAGDRFVIRRLSPALTLGGGEVVDPHMQVLRSNSRTDFLDQLLGATIVQRLIVTSRLAGLRGVSLSELQAQTGMTRRALQKSVGTKSPEGLVPVAGSRWIHEDFIRDIRRKAMTLLTDYFRGNRVAAGYPRGEFLQKLLPAVTTQSIADFVLSDLTAEKIVLLEGDLVDVPGRSKDLGGAEGALAKTIEERFRVTGLTPPPVSELIRAIPQKPKVIEGVITYLVKIGKLVRLAEGIYVHPDTVNAAREKLIGHEGEQCDVAWFKDFYGISRKVTIPLLEHFDEIGVTRRMLEGRQILRPGP